MRIEKGIISSLQLKLMVMGLILGSVLTVTFTFGITKQDTWIVILSGLVFALLMAYIYISLLNKFSKKNIIEINDKVYGRFIGKFISILYIFHFFLIVPRNLRFIGDFSTQNLLVKTPMIVIVGSFALVCGYAVRNGLEVIARCATILTISGFVITLTLTFLVLKEADITNFLPLLQINLNEFVQGTHIIFAIPFSEIMVFFMIAPYTNETKKIKSSIFIGTIISGLYLCMVSLRNIAVLGAITFTSSFTAYQEATLVDVGRIITRMEVLVALAFLITMFIKVSLCFYTSVLSIAQFFYLRDYKFLVFPCGIIMVCFSFTIYSNSVEHSYAGSNVYPIYSFPIEVIIPILTLIIAKIRKLPKKIA